MHRDTWNDQRCAVWRLHNCAQVFGTNVEPSGTSRLLRWRALAPYKIGPSATISTNHSRGNNQTLHPERWRALASYSLELGAISGQTFCQRIQSLMTKRSPLWEGPSGRAPLGGPLWEGPSSLKRLYRKMSGNKPSDIVLSEPLENPSDDGSFTAIRKRECYCHTTP
jgi:hypothetical protein